MKDFKSWLDAFNANQNNKPLTLAQKRKLLKRRYKNAIGNGKYAKMLPNLYKVIDLAPEQLIDQELKTDIEREIDVIKKFGEHWEKGEGNPAFN